MKITGIVMALMGVVILAVAGAMSTQTPGTSGGPEEISSSLFAGKGLLILGVFGLMALVAGAAILVFGGRGYFVTYDPAARR